MIKTYFILFSANSLSQDAKRKRLLAKDIFEALNDLDFDFLIPPLQSALAGRFFQFYYNFNYFSYQICFFYH